MNKQNLDRIETTVNSMGEICLSAISIWEIAMLEKKKRIILAAPIGEWLEEAVDASSVNIIGLSPHILVDSCNLPGEFHSDPADRMIVSTSRINNIPLITQDEKILKYIDSGFCPG
ncbi:hypothetical protein FACS1894152_7350 [Bacilli bacterium]|nr:hypothetical protein FACS1894152_7350 [Bacilli bacterium]